MDLGRHFLGAHYICVIEYNGIKLIGNIRTLLTSQRIFILIRKKLINKTNEKTILLQNLKLPVQVHDYIGVVFLL